MRRAFQRGSGANLLKKPNAPESPRNPKTHVCAAPNTRTTRNLARRPLEVLKFGRRTRRSFAYGIARKEVRDHPSIAFSLQINAVILGNGELRLIGVFVQWAT